MCLSLVNAMSPVTWNHLAFKRRQSQFIKNASSSEKKNYFLPRKSLSLSAQRAPLHSLQLFICVSYTDYTLYLSQIYEQSITV